MNTIVKKALIYSGLGYCAWSVLLSARSWWCLSRIAKHYGCTALEAAAEAANEFGTWGTAQKMVAIGMYSIQHPFTWFDPIEES